MKEFTVYLDRSSLNYQKKYDSYYWKQTLIKKFSRKIVNKCEQKNNQNIRMNILKKNVGKMHYLLIDSPFILCNFHQYSYFLNLFYELTNFCIAFELTFLPFPFFVFFCSPVIYTNSSWTFKDFLLKKKQILKKIIPIKNIW